MFDGCYKIESIPLIDTSNVTNMRSMFYDCRKLKTIPSLDTNKVTNMSNMFAMGSTSLLESIPELNGESLINVNNIFYASSDYFNNFTNFGGLKDLGKAYTQKSNNYSNYRLSLTNVTNLTHESLMNVINNLYDLNITYDVANGGTLYTQSLQLGSTNTAKLTAEEIAVATSRGWTVS
jgi:surface protein